MPATRKVPSALVVCTLLLVAPSAALAGPPVALGTLDVRGTAPTVLAVVVIRPSPTPPEPALTALPAAARTHYVATRAAEAERLQIQRAMVARGVARTAEGPTLRAIIARESVARSRLRRVLEQGAATLGAAGWLLLGDLRRAEAYDRYTNAQSTPTPAEFSGARTAYIQAAALGGTSTTGLWARYGESELAMLAEDSATARSALAVVIANAPSSTLRATALALQAELSDDPRLLARAAAEGADAPLRAYIRFASMLAERFRDPIAARDSGIAILADGDDATAERTALIVGELLVRTGDPSGTSLPATISADRAIRTLVAASDAARAIAEPSWAEMALRAAVARAPDSTAARAAAALFGADTAVARETVAQWLQRQANRCHGDALVVDARETTGELDVLVRRQRGVVRVVARVRPGAGRGAARFERCIEGALPDPPALDATTIYQGALRLR